MKGSVYYQSEGYTHSAIQVFPSESKECSIQTEGKLSVHQLHGFFFPQRELAKEMVDNLSIYSKLLGGKTMMKTHISQLKFSCKNEQEDSSFEMA